MLTNLNKNKFDLALSLNLHQGELRDNIPKDIKTTIYAYGKEDFPKNKSLNLFFLGFRAIKLELYRRFPIIPNKYIIKNNYDVEIATSYNVFSEVLNSSNKNSKKIGWLHSDLTYPKFKPVLSKILKEIEKFDYFFWGSQQAYDVFIENFPDVKLPPNQVIRNAIPFEDIKLKSEEFIPDLKTKDPVFVTVGRLHSRKGHHFLIEAHNRLLREGLLHKIYVIGDGEEKENLENLINELGVQDSFILLGTLTNPYPYIKKADFFMLPSESEGWPLVIAESLILKKVILATNVGGIPEMISHKKNGYLVNYSIEDIKNGMKDLMENKDVVLDINKGLIEIEKQFDNQLIFDTVENVITKMVNKS